MESALRRRVRARVRAWLTVVVQVAARVASTPWDSCVHDSLRGCLRDILDISGFLA